MDTQRIARLERAVTQLRVIAIATTLAALAAGITAVIAVREPTELRIGSMRIDEHSLTFEEGVYRTSIGARGLSVTSGDGARAGVNRGQIFVNDGTTTVMLVADGDRGTVAIEAPVGRATMEVRGGAPTLNLSGEHGTVLQVPAP